jgi:hypothetical protein
MGSVLEARALLKRFIEHHRRATLDLQQALKKYALDRPQRRGPGSRLDWTSGSTACGWS